MKDIKLITKDTDIEKLEMRKLNWDVIIKGVPYYVVRIPGYVHSIVGIYNGENDLWAYPRNENPSYENLIEYSTNQFGVLWGYRYEPYNYIKHKWGEAECYTCNKYIITRNGEDFYDDCYSIEEVLTKINRLKEHPISFNSINWKDEIIGRKIWWRSQPAIIDRYVNKQAAIIIKPDGIDKFKIPAEYRKDDMFLSEEDEDDIKTSIFDEHIYWFR